MAKPRLPLAQLAEAYGYRYLEHVCGTDYSEVLQALADSTGPTILRVIIDPIYSAKLL